MFLQIAKHLIAAVVAIGVFHADVVHGQQLAVPLQLTSLEWLVADSDVVVRGVVADIVLDQPQNGQGHWNIVTFDVIETMKGPKTQQVKFALYRLDRNPLAEAMKSKRELLWILKRQPANTPGSGAAPDRELMLARNKIDLYAPFLTGRPGEPALPVIPLGPQEAEAVLHPPALLTIDLRVLKTSDELVKAIRTAIAEPQGSGPVRSYSLAVSQHVARRTGFSRDLNSLTVPVDRRLEEFARQLVLSPGDFFPSNAVRAENEDDIFWLAEHRKLLRLEGVKALRLFPSEKNLAIVRAWLDDPISAQPYKGDRQTLVPAMPSDQLKEMEKLRQIIDGVVLPAKLAEVPEVHFQQPLTKAMKTADAQLHTAVTIESVNLLNQKKTDAFIETLMSKRPDLAGLSFAMGDACRMKPEAGRQFVAALEVFRKAEGRVTGSNTIGSTNIVSTEIKGVMQRYKEQSPEQKIDPSARVASLMQVLGHEDGNTRLGLVVYLDGMADAAATRALAKLAIFSAEPEVRAAAVRSLKMRRDRDYTDILLSGLKYPWPEVAERTSEAIVKLGRGDLVPHLIDVLEKPDPRAPQTQEVNGKKVTVVRELVRVNHHHNCLLCHAPAPAPGEKSAKEETAKLLGLTAQVPVPSESMVAYYRPSNPDILVRFDVTYLRQDFSLKLAVANADPWPEMQRYDFLVRTREVTEKEALAYEKLLVSNDSKELSPYRRAALTALRELTGRDAEGNATAWR